jgi:hypothetical protein
MKKRGILFTFVCFFAFIVLACTACTATPKSHLNHFGKGTIELTVKSALNLQDYKAHLSEMLTAYHSVSSDDDILTVNEIVPIEKGYKIYIDIRRIDKVRGIGEFEYGTAQQMFREGSETLTLLENFNKGNLRMSTRIMKGGYSEQINISKAQNDVKIKPYQSGKSVAWGDLVNFVAEKGEKYQAVIFRMFDVPQIQSITVSFPDKIQYYAGNGVTLVNENTLRITPEPITADLQQITDSGVELKKDAQIESMLGYVIYDKGANPVVVWLLIALGGLLVLGVVVLYLYFGYAQGGIKRAKEEYALKTVLDESEAGTEK